ncbi:MAG: hypothetical protein IPP71_07845 [Bacteroidetes bacterium]|nr:hypothetical protein [Bacteroidota bacterium]
MRKKYYLLSIILAMFNSIGIAQQKLQVKADSLLTVYSKTEIDSVKCTLLFEISKLYWFTNLSKGIDYGNRSLMLAKKINYNKGIVEGNYSLAYLNLNRGKYYEALEFSNNTLISLKKSKDEYIEAMTYANLGFIYNYLGKVKQAQENCYKAIDLATKLNFLECVAIGFTNLGTIYFWIGNDEESLKNYTHAMDIAKKIKYKLYIAANYHNIAIFKQIDKNWNESTADVKLALKINQEIENKLWEGYNYNSLGSNYLEQGKSVEALQFYLAGLKISHEIEDYSNLSTCLNNIGHLYMRQKNYVLAKKYFDESLSYSIKSNFAIGIPDNYEGLAMLDTTIGNWKSAFANLKLQMLYKDSFVNDENTKKLLQTSMQFEFDAKEALTKAAQEKKDALALKELEKQKLVRNGFVGGFSVVLLFAGVFFAQRNKIKKGKQRSDELLLNILPGEVAEELKSKGSADAKQFDQVTVMFTDFKGFTQISEKLSPSELVAEIHTCFKAFDDIITKFNIEKIKTIGDSYMCAGGLPLTNKTNAIDVVNAALEIQQFMLLHLKQRSAENKEPFEIRIGIHTGPVVAGIVGIKKFAYDIWGDTVNIASRMESSGQPGKINISGSTYELVKDKFNCAHRGKIPAKNKGEIDMYFLERI